MSKKLIAVAAAAALALTGLVGVAPANADVGATFHLNGASGSADATAFVPSATAAAENAGAGNLVVPANNRLTYTDTADRSSLVKVIVSTTVGQTVTAASTGGLKILDLNDVGTIGSDYRAETSPGAVDYTSTAGAQSLSRVATTNNVTFYIFTTSSTAASLTISKAGNTRVVWFKGKPGPAYNITAALPAIIPTTAPATNNVIAKITDVFGNQVESSVGVTSSVTGTGVTLTPSAGAQTVAYSATEGGHGYNLSKSTPGGLALQLSITADPANVSGLPTANKVWFATTSIVDLSVQVTALTAQVAALRADYNALAERWNKRVASKKAPKKAVTLK